MTSCATNNTTSAKFSESAAKSTDDQLSVTAPQPNKWLKYKAVTVFKSPVAQQKRSAAFMAADEAEIACGSAAVNQPNVTAASSTAKSEADDTANADRSSIGAAKQRQKEDSNNIKHTANRPADTSSNINGTVGDPSNNKDTANAAADSTSRQPPPPTPPEQQELPTTRDGNAAAVAVDALPRVREMRDALRRVAAQCLRRGQRATVAAAAERRLAHVEDEIQRLKFERTEAILRANAPLARELACQISELSAHALLNANADFLLSLDDEIERKSPTVTTARSTARSSPSSGSGEVFAARNRAIRPNGRAIRARRSPHSAADVLVNGDSCGYTASRRHSGGCGGGRKTLKIGHYGREYYRKRDSIEDDRSYSTSSANSRADITAYDNDDDGAYRSAQRRRRYDSRPESKTDKNLRQRVKNAKKRNSTRQTKHASFATAPEVGDDDASRGTSAKTANRAPGAVDGAPSPLPREFKRNRRLFPAEEDDDGDEERGGALPAVISSAALCPYCRARDPGFVNADFLKQHYADACTSLCRCDFCDKVVEAAELNDHHINRCPFVDDSLEPCQRCGLARFVGEITHPQCKTAMPPDGGAWCPLCSALIPLNNRATWRTHLADDCYNNPRNQRWPRVNEDALVEGEVDKRGESLLANLNHDEHENDPRSRRRTRAAAANGSAASNAIQIQQHNAAAQIDVNQVRNAIKRLNREWRGRNRASSSAPITSQRIIHHDDSD